MIKPVILICFILFSKLNVYSQDEFASWFKGLNTDTIYTADRKIKEVRAFKNEDSLIYKTKYIRDTLYSKEIYITYGFYKIFLFCRKHEYYKNSQIKLDSLVDERNSLNKKVIVREFQPTGEKIREIIQYGKRVKGRGFIETFSWGTNWRSRTKIWNDFGELIYEEKSKLYHR